MIFQLPVAWNRVTYGVDASGNKTPWLDGTSDHSGLLWDYVALSPKAGGVYHLDYFPPQELGTPFRHTPANTPSATWRLSSFPTKVSVNGGPTWPVRYRRMLTPPGIEGCDEISVWAALVVLSADEAIAFIDQASVVQAQPAPPPPPPPQVLFRHLAGGYWEPISILGLPRQVPGVHGRLLAVRRGKRREVRVWGDGPKPHTMEPRPPYADIVMWSHLTLNGIALDFMSVGRERWVAQVTDDQMSEILGRDR